jgi:GNAT superfamily N-acetyltransferase
MTERVLAGHGAWTRLASPPPPGVVFVREEGRLGAEAFIDLVRRSGLNRPVGEVARVEAMLAHANLLVTAREAEGAGRLIGLARSLTDFAYCCYLSDLCVDAASQGRDVGRALVAETKRVVGPGAMVLLLSAPGAMEYYPQIGMERVANGFIICRDG